MKSPAVTLAALFSLFAGSGHSIESIERIGRRGPSIPKGLRGRALTWITGKAECCQNVECKGPLPPTPVGTVRFYCSRDCRRGRPRRAQACEEGRLTAPGRLRSALELPSLVPGVEAAVREPNVEQGCPCCKGSGVHALEHLEGPYAHEWTADCAACRDGVYRGNDCTDLELSPHVEAS